MVNNILPPLNDDVTRSQFPLKKSMLPGNSIAITKKVLAALAVASVKYVLAFYCHKIE